MVLFCVAQRHSVVIMNTEQCPSVANHPIKREGELFTGKLVLTKRFLWTKGCYDVFLCAL